MDPQVGIIMGSDSDLPTMQAAADVLKEFGIEFEMTVVSAHRTPLRMVEYAQAVPLIFRGWLLLLLHYLSLVFLSNLPTRSTDGIPFFPYYKCQMEFQ